MHIGENQSCKDEGESRALVRLVRSQAPHLKFSHFNSGCLLGRRGTWLSVYGARTDTTQPTAVHKRWLAQSSASQGDNRISVGPRKGVEIGNDEKDSGVVYYGPILHYKKVKLLSLSTCCLSVSLGPVIIFMTSPYMNVILKGAVAFCVIFISATTTVVLHWFVSPCNTSSNGSQVQILLK
ncbi:hypothetical protein K7X08_006162 [Anisodus acutangulus]|uniref:Uncharacterized protein n=1 Tax=Anisodus acutangulus TaxID=402998 RepID=A0A9Q1LUX2_9SOLA|nr:hypothetical protein K7X08_006162 [Anisodus acutangulus]